MYAYCNNNSINMVDKNGNYPVTVLSNTISFVSGKGSAGLLATYAGLGGMALADGPLPFGDALAIGGALLITTGVISQEISQPKAVQKEEEEVKVVAKTSSKNNQAYFPINPYEFKPKGLVMSEYPGTKNGRIIKWREPLSNATIFEWNEDFKMGAHYHTMMIEWSGKHLGMHYYPGMPVPEPWNSIYFGGER